MTKFRKEEWVMVNIEPLREQIGTYIYFRNKKGGKQMKIFCDKIYRNFVPQLGEVLLDRIEKFLKK